MQENEDIEVYTVAMLIDRLKEFPADTKVEIAYEGISQPIDIVMLDRDEITQEKRVYLGNYETI